MATATSSPFSHVAGTAQPKLALIANEQSARIQSGNIGLVHRAVAKIVLIAVLFVVVGVITGAAFLRFP
jgi:hypothetical protein